MLFVYFWFKNIEIEPIKIALEKVDKWGLYVIGYSYEGFIKVNKFICVINHTKIKIKNALSVTYFLIMFAQENQKIMFVKKNKLIERK